MPLWKVYASGVLLALLCDGGEDSLAAGDEVAEVAELVFNIANLDFVGRTGRLFTVARDKRDSPAFLEQRGGRAERLKRYVQ